MAFVQLFGTGSPYQSDGRLADWLDKFSRAIVEKLQQWNPDELLNTPVDDVVDYLIGEGSIDCPVLLTEDAYQLEPFETFQQYIDFDRPRRRVVLRFVLVVPFDGDSEVFKLRPDTSTLTPPQVLKLGSDELQLAIDDPVKDSDAIRQGFERQVNEIEKHLAWSRQQINLHNQLLADELPGMVTQRREQLLAMRNLQTNVGFPVRRRPDADRYVVPTRRKTLRPRPPRPTSTHSSFAPEPVLGETDYQEALRVLRSSRNQLERTPSVASKLNEEEIRDILLINLNSQFEGTAGGELFNGAGKTDILIRERDRNVFIGECKVWSGPKTMDEALAQLFGYLVWRDTKAAILLFIRRKDVTAIIEKAVAKVEEHPNHKRTIRRSSDFGEFEFTMHANEDPNREIRLTLIPFALRTPE